MIVDGTILNETKGFLDKAEGEVLYRCALAASSLGPCLEIGSYCGKSSLFIGTACQQTGNVLFSIDHHRGSEEQQAGELYFDPALVDGETLTIDTFSHFRRTLVKAGLEDTVVPLVSSSKLAAKKWQTPLGLVFIDGGHSYEAVKTDYEVWHSHLLYGGFLLFHDIYENPAEGGQAPYRVYRQALASKAFTAEAMVGSLGVLKKSG